MIKDISIKEVEIIVGGACAIRCNNGFHVYIANVREACILKYFMLVAQTSGCVFYHFPGELPSEEELNQVFTKHQAALAKPQSCCVLQ